MKLISKVKQLPNQPGVYLYRDQARQVIYVGKAVDLKKRVSQYFHKRPLDTKTRALVGAIADVEVLEVESELDALFLESELVKRHQPKFNILLRDDKSPTYLKIAWQKDIPDISFCRLPKDDGAEYLGPFYSVRPVRQAMRYLRRIYPYFAKPYQPVGRPSLDRHLGLEPAIKTAAEIKQYRANLRQISRLVRGERPQLMRELEQKMKQAAKKQQFERAAFYRNQLSRLKNLQYQVTIRSEDESFRHRDSSLRQLKQMFGLAKVPYRIEGFDVSHWGGANVVASMVVFLNGLSERSEYRRFKIKVDQNDDVYNLREAIDRRFSPANIAKWGLPDLILVDGGKGQLRAAIQALKDRGLKLPVIGLAEREEEIIIDSAESKVQIPKTALPDGRFFIVKLQPDHEVRKFFQRIRDEAHRFAVNYHSQLRQKHQTDSFLSHLRGIGPITEQKLVKHFKSVARLKRASLAELAAVVGPHRAKIVRQALKTSDKSP